MLLAASASAAFVDGFVLEGVGFGGDVVGVVLVLVGLLGFLVEARVVVVVAWERGTGVVVVTHLKNYY